MAGATMEWFGAFKFALLALSQMQWFRLISSNVPEPYLDEVFHIPQAQAYWQGKWRYWDSKITTPPGLYLWSYAVNTIATKLQLSYAKVNLSTEDLRGSNVVLLWVLSGVLSLWSAMSRARHLNSKHGSMMIMPSRERSIVAFPLFFFFSGLYYTDLFSVVTVMVTYICWQAGSNTRTSTRKPMCQILHLLSGLVSLTARQTNIFWVAIFLGGLQVIESIKQTTRVHDPPVTDAYFEDYPTMIISLTTSALSILPSLLLDLWPHLALLASFAAFILWNGGVVLGDKSNHIATVHLPQMLYIWPFLIFFSWPVILPHLTSLSSLRGNLPRFWIVGLLSVIALATVHLNTIIHPFTLADNRHYTFYVFKIIRARWWIRYALVPIYIVCGWLAILALGKPALIESSGRAVAAHSAATEDNFSTVTKTTTSTRRKLSTSSGKGDAIDIEEAGTVRISFILVWLISTALSLVTAPLVEPRYFIVPWLIWRLHVSEYHAPSKPQSTDKGALQRALSLLAKFNLRVELGWYMLVNYVTCWIFLYKEFSWIQEPGKVQRFMW